VTREQIDDIFTYPAPFAIKPRATAKLGVYDSRVALRTLGMQQRREERYVG
jgi:hypothetical protein